MIVAQKQVLPLCTAREHACVLRIIIGADLDLRDWGNVWEKVLLDLCIKHSIGELVRLLL